MFMRIGPLVFAGLIGLGSTESVHAFEPFRLAERAANELYIKPLRLKGAKLKIETEPFPVGCPATAITVRVLLPANGRDREVLKVNTFVLEGRLEFVGASGSALHDISQQDANQAIAQTMMLLAELNGWAAIDEPARLGAKKGYIERRMRNPKIRTEYELDVKTIVFNQRLGVPVLIGAPPAPTAAGCE